ncbi:TRAP transporter substrate-binding protein [Kribbella sp. NBC_00889]|uniref:TRAP transporter substrate-binding protein n=1 Tax=Kribbella sp. NBC_00889 TaxID=2975974 RepID=UPI0038701DD6|nr:TRAP transporter substrate-binding protein DctP [Kribbella sp. NBC_00889]
MNPRRRLGIFTLVLALLGAAVACGKDAPATTAEADAGPVTIQIGTADDDPDSPGGIAIMKLVELVRVGSGGEVLIYPVWQASGQESVEWDQKIARMVKEKQLGMGMVPARAWDAEGVTSFRALNAPFLVTSDALADKIVTSSDLSTELMSGLEAAGVTGLTLLPESPRHTFGFRHALVRVEDYNLQTIRTPHSVLNEATFRALGGKPVDLTDSSFVQGVQDGSMAGVESGFLLARGLPAPSTAAGNVTLNEKVNTLVINPEVYAELSEDNRSVLQTAVKDLQEWVLANRTTETANAVAFCNLGGKIVTASAADLAALTKAVQPVYAELAKDAKTQAQVERIRTLKQSIQVPPEDLANPCP